MSRATGWGQVAICAGLVWSVIVTGLATPTAVQAQNYETQTVSERYLVPVLTGRETAAERAELQPKVNLAKQNIAEDAGAIQDCLKANSARPDNFDRFFQEYLFAEMTQTSDANLSTLGAKRADFLRKYLSADANGANRTYLIEDQLLPAMKRIAEGNFHPAVRLNAVLMIGIANSSEGNSLANEAPTPNPACVKYLIGLLKQDQLPLYLRVGVFTGLHRVSQLEGLVPRLEQADVKEISDAALAVTEKKYPGQEGWDPDANYWLRRRAIQILGFLRKPGENGTVVNALLAVLGDEKNEFQVRLDAIDSLSQLNYENAAPVARVKDVSEGVAAFASQALLNQADKVRQDVEEFIAINLMNDGAFLLRGGAKRDAAGGGGKDGDRPGAGAGGLDGGNEDSGQQNQADPNAPVFDMPNYYLNVERRACKNYVFVCQNLFSRTGTWYPLATDAERSFVDKARAVLDEVMDKSDVGLVDLSKAEDAPKETDAREKLGVDSDKGPRKGATFEMVKLFETAGRKLKDLVAPQQKPAAENAPPGAAGN